MGVAPGGTAATDPGAATVAVLASFTPPGGASWCSILGKAPGSPIDATDVEKIAGFVLEWYVHNGGGDPTGSFLLPWNVPIGVQLVQTIRNGLTPLIGKMTCDGLPANLEDLPTIKAATPPSNVGQLFNVLLDWTGLGDILMRAGVLIVILVLLLLAVRRVLD